MHLCDTIDRYLTLDLKRLWMHIVHVLVGDDQYTFLELHVLVHLVQFGTKVQVLITVLLEQRLDDGIVGLEATGTTERFHWLNGFVLVQIGVGVLLLVVVFNFFSTSVRVVERCGALDASKEVFTVGWSVVGHVVESCCEVFCC